MKEFLYTMKDNEIPGFTNCISSSRVRTGARDNFLELGRQQVSEFVI